MNSPGRPPVKTRVLARESAGTVLLADLVSVRIENGDCGSLEIVGEPGAGKTSAISELALLPGSERIRLIDDARRFDVETAERNQLVVYTTGHSLKPVDASYRLAPWTDDDLIEYLLAAHPERCASVMRRISADADRRNLKGVPRLWAIALEQMAADESLSDVRTALRQGIAELFGDEQTLQRVRRFALEWLIAPGQFAAQLQQQGAGHLTTEQVAVLRQRLVQVLLASDLVSTSVRRSAEAAFPAGPMPRDLVQETASRVAGDADARKELRKLLKRVESAPMAASILHLTDPVWKPQRKKIATLRGAYLSEANWKGVDLSRLDLEECDLRQAELSNAALDSAQLSRADFSNACLHGAVLNRVHAAGAVFRRAELSGAKLRRGDFQAADFSEADMSGADAVEADFRSANLSEASFRGARLTGSTFLWANIDDADFRGADLAGATLSHLCLRKAHLQGAAFSHARLQECDLELIELAEAQFREADLTDALLTATKMRGGDFRNAILCGSGLADIDWEGADLSGADLRGCSFHLGSSRSGLVGSPFASHGTRTGFYTNDFDDQCYKPPEDVRKANLRGADLRGARIDDVDFYLVDLRNAKYDPHQAKHLRRCDAILVDRD